MSRKYNIIGVQEIQDTWEEISKKLLQDLQPVLI